jgi:hypothetical protein
MSRETFEERWRSFTTLETWLEIREAHGRSMSRMFPTGFRIDPSHSALLARLLDGRNP